MARSWLRWLLLASLAPTAAAPVSAPDKVLIGADRDHDNWRLHGRTYDNQRFSPLTGINRENVGRLKLLHVLHTGVANSFEATPLEVDGVLYTVTATNHVHAWDAVTGRQLWAWQPDRLDFTEACCGPQARGVALAYGKVYTALLDGHLVALDAKTGKLVWQTDPEKTHPEPKHYYTYTLAPQVYAGMVIVGTAGAEYETRGMVEAYDAQTGAKLWEFRTTAAPNEPGGDTWGGTDAWKLGGGSVWNTPAVDVKNDLLVLSTGNPNPDYQGETRPGDNA
jgi:alcohol dehydrogenase (cytochrome c)